MKKILCISLILSLAFSLIVFGAETNESIDKSKPYIDFVTEDITAGSVTNISAEIHNNTGIWGIRFKLNYDSELILQTDEDGVLYTTDNAFENPVMLDSDNILSYVFTNSTDANINDNGALFTVSYKIPEDCNDGDYYLISVEDVEVIDEDGNDVKMQFADPSLYTAGAEVTTVTTVAPTTTIAQQQSSTNTTASSTTGGEYENSTVAINKTTNVEYTTFEAAIKAAGDNHTILLLKDATLTAGSNPLTFTNYSQTIDLGGHTLTAPMSRFFNGPAASIEYTFKNGTINQTANTSASSCDVMFFIREKFTLNLEDITLNQTYSGTYGMIDFRQTSANGSATVNLDNVTINSAGNVFQRDSLTYSLNINNSNITCGANKCVFNSASLWSGNGSIIVSNTKFATNSASFATNDFKNVKVNSNSIVSATKNGSAIEGAVDGDNTLVSSVIKSANVNSLYIYEQSAVDLSLSMVKGASIRLDDVNGIRFITQIDEDEYNSLIESGYTVELGTLIAPLDLILEN